MHFFLVDCLTIDWQEMDDQTNGKICHTFVYTGNIVALVCKMHGYYKYIVMLIARASDW